MTRLATQLRTFVEERPRWTAAFLVVVASVVLLARLGSPDRIMFDEVYYVEDARGYLQHGVEPSFAVHPTVGKWLIAAGMAVVGDDPLGWRIAGAVAGITIVLLTHLLTRRVLAGTRWGSLLAVVAPLLLLTDGLFVTQSRISMLDIFLVLFAVTAIQLLVVDRDRRRAGLVRPRRPSVRVLAGVALGLASAVKWSGLLVIGAAGLLTIGWELAAAYRASSGDASGSSRDASGSSGDASGSSRDASGSSGDASGSSKGGVLARSLLRRGAAVLGSLVLVPALVYSVTWIPWLANYEHTWAADCEDVEPISDCADADAPLAERVDGLLRYHEQGINFHLTLESEHDYRSDPLTWVLLRRPVVYYWETCSEDRANGVLVEDEETGEMVPPEPCDVPVGTAGEVLAVGNPAVWWTFLGVLPLLVGGVLRRDRRSAVALVAWASLWIPWLFVSRAAFLFYMAPAVPFIVLGIATGIARLDVRHRLLGAYLGGALGALLGLVSGWAVQALGYAAGGWRPRLLAAAVGAACATVAGAVRDHRRDREDPVARPPFAAPAGPPGSPDGATVADAPAPAPATAPVAEPSTAGQGIAVRVLHDGPATGADASTPAAGHAVDPVDPVDAGAPTPVRDREVLAPSWLVPGLAVALLVVSFSLWVFFGPVWYGVPLDRDVLEWRWWFDSWI